MKNPICPHCSKKTLDVLGVYLKLDARYLLNSENWSPLYRPWSNIWKVRRKRNKFKILGFYCRSCEKPFPEKMNRQIWKYLKYRKVLKHLQKPDPCF